MLFCLLCLTFCPSARRTWVEDACYSALCCLYAWPSTCTGLQAELKKATSFCWSVLLCWRSLTLLHTHTHTYYLLLVTAEEEEHALETYSPRHTYGAAMVSGKGHQR